MSEMSSGRSRYGLMISALGAIVLAVSVFLPWYGVSFTPQGISFAQQVGQQALAQYGNAAAQSYVGALHANLSGLAGQQFMSLSAHDTLKDLSVLLLILAGLAMFDALVPLARAAGPIPDGAGRSVVLLGCVACACVGYRMLTPPNPAGTLLTLSVREGAWLALLGSLAMVIGGLWPQSEPQPRTASAGEPRHAL
jgi:hypothetical protein